MREAAHNTKHMSLYIFPGRRERVVKKEREWVSHAWEQHTRTHLTTQASDYQIFIGGGCFVQIFLGTKKKCVLVSGDKIFCEEKKEEMTTNSWRTQPCVLLCEDGRRKGALSQAWKIHSFLQVQQVSVGAADSPCLVNQRLRKQLLHPDSRSGSSQQRGQQQLQPGQHSSQALLVTGFRVFYPFVSVIDSVPAQEVLSNHKLSPEWPQVWLVVSHFVKKNS